MLSQNENKLTVCVQKKSTTGQVNQLLGYELQPRIDSEDSKENILNAHRRRVMSVKCKMYNE